MAQRLESLQYLPGEVVPVKVARLIGSVYFDLEDRFGGVKMACWGGEMRKEGRLTKEAKFPWKSGGMHVIRENRFFLRK